MPKARENVLDKALFLNLMCKDYPENASGSAGQRTFFEKN